MAGGKPSPASLLRAPLPLRSGKHPQTPPLQPRPADQDSDLPSCLVRPSLQPPQAPPRIPADPKPTNPPVLRILGFVDSGPVALQPTNWSGRTGLFPGALPLAQSRAPKFRSPATRAPTLDSSHPGSRRRPRFHSLNDPFLIAGKAGIGGMAGDPIRVGGERLSPGSAALSRRRIGLLARKTANGLKDKKPEFPSPQPNQSNIQ